MVARPWQPRNLQFISGSIEQVSVENMLMIELVVGLCML